MLASALFFATSPWSVLGSCSCHTALGMPCHSLVAMTLQCPCNDTPVKTDCPSQRMSKCFQGARQRRGMDSEVR